MPAAIGEVFPDAVYEYVYLRAGAFPVVWCGRSVSGQKIPLGDVALFDVVDVADFVARAVVEAYELPADSE